MSVVITLGALSLGSGPDGDGNTWKWTELEGWDSPELRAAMLDLPGQHREAPGPFFFGRRALSLQGNVSCPSLAAYWSARTKLATATALTATPGSLTVAETVAKKIAVRRGGRVLQRPFETLNGFTFDVPLIAPDPRILAATATTITPGGTATNTGNIGASPVLTVTGSAAGPIVIANTTAGRTVTVATAVPGGQQLVIDFLARSILLNGVNRYDLVSGTPQWFDIAPGANTITYSGGGTPSLSWNDSWI